MCVKKVYHATTRAHTHTHTHTHTHIHIYIHTYNLSINFTLWWCTLLKECTPWSDSSFFLSFFKTALFYITTTHPDICTNVKPRRQRNGKVLRWNALLRSQDIQSWHSDRSARQTKTGKITWCDRTDNPTMLKETRGSKLEGFFNTTIQWWKIH